MERRLPERHLPAVTVAAAVATIAVLTLTGSLVAGTISDWVGHGLGHAVVALPVAVLALIALRSWPAPKMVAPSRVARRVVVAGFLGVATGQALEVLGARVDEQNAHAVDAAAHTAGQIVTMLSMLVLLAGSGLAAVAAARAGTAPRWVVAAGFILALVGFVFLFAGGPGG